MPEYRHPRALDDVDGHPPARVHISRGEKAAVSDGTFETDEKGVVRRIASAYGVTLADLEVSESDGGSAETEAYTCVGADGDCSREVDAEGGRCWQHAEDTDTDTEDS